MSDNMDVMMSLSAGEQAAAGIFGTLGIVLVLAGLLFLLKSRMQGEVGCGNQGRDQGRGHLPQARPGQPRKRKSAPNSSATFLTRLTSSSTTPGWRSAGPR